MRKILDFFINGKFLNSLWFWGIAISLTCFIITQKGCKREKEKVPNLEYKVPEKKWIDEGGVQHNQITQEVTSSEILNQLVDSLISENKNLKNAISLTQATLRVDTVFRDRIVNLDTTTGDFELSKKDQWVDIVARGNIKKGRGEISIKTWDTLNIVTTKKKHLFSPDETIIDISSQNPYNQVDKIRSFRIPERKSIIVVGPMVGIGYTGDKIKPFVGVGITYNLFSIKTK